MIFCKRVMPSFPLFLKNDSVSNFLTSISILNLTRTPQLNFCVPSFYYLFYRYNVVNTILNTLIVIRYNLLYLIS